MHGSLIDNSATRGQQKRGLQLALSFVFNFNLYMAPLELLCKMNLKLTVCLWLSVDSGGTALPLHLQNMEIQTQSHALFQITLQ